MLIDDLVADYNKSVNVNNKQVMYNIYININKSQDIKPHYANIGSNQVLECTMRDWLKNNVKYKILKDDVLLIKQDDYYVVHELIYKDMDIDYKYNECEKEGVFIYSKTMALRPPPLVLPMYDYYEWTE